MGFVPELNPLACPFCRRAFRLPEVRRAVRFQDARRGFDHSSRASSCGCGAFVIVDTDVREDEAELRAWARGADRVVAALIVERVDHYTMEEREAYADALFYRFLS